QTFGHFTPTSTRAGARPRRWVAGLYAAGDGRDVRSPTRREAGPSGRLALAVLPPPLDVVAHPLAVLPVPALRLGLDPQAGDRRRPAVVAEGDEAEVTDGAQAPLAGERVLAVDLAAHDHARPPGPGDAAPDLDDLADVDRRAEVDRLGGGGHHDAAAEARAGHGRVHVHELQEASAEHGAQGVHLVGEDRVDGDDPVGDAGLERFLLHPSSIGSPRPRANIGGDDA